MKTTSSGLVLKYAVADFVREILFLQVWWYTIGLVRTVAWCGRSIHGAAESTGLILWAKNLFVPMYGETGFTGRAVSFFIRFVMIIFRGIATAAWMVVVLLLFVVYMIAIPVSVAGIFYHGVGMFVK